ncbi:metallophosphoesterase [Rhodoferax antarcticus]|uniref:Calcineurin-like phosphoesterase family protein n=1 Tax=Rhodoferax antarcticus ANT.BR TaxID=1111071 RepID=A0A1Q8YIG9_9BURK|nr:metallophosphoesterase [Rhodoferax antarcticus]APW47990.1 metallophosphoesterase [Rhodoferax antarcticus]OLP07806.1 calcineurin-like phosphoesterase family protein [Rhodoferax antarcticus ANT.BR]
MRYDIIGDIHGHADALKALLLSMGYTEGKGRAWRHPQRQAVFVGDFIDRGPRQIETVDIVRRMVQEGSAQAVMGNHEFNAIAWFLPDPDQSGEYLRPHHSKEYGAKNYAQHKAFLEEVNGTPAHKEIIDWFLTLPLWLELDGIRVVHACWHAGFMAYLETQGLQDRRLTAELMIEASREPADEAEKDTPTPSIFKAVEALTKGVEVPLPGSHFFVDKDGHTRKRVRTRWWDPHAVTYRKAAMINDEARTELPHDPIPEHNRIGHDGGTPVIVGHYWGSGTPALLSDKVACVDYSIGKGGKLVAYRWDGEPLLEQRKFHWIGA